MSIKRVIRKVGGKALYLLKCFKWYCFYMRTTWRPQKPNYTLSDDWYLNERVLLIAPHADDELLSSYTLIKRCPNIAVYYCGFTGSNNSEDNRRIRYNEIKSVCRECGVPIIYGGGDCNNLEQVMRSFDTIVIPSVVDWHFEHRKVSYLIYDILQRTKQVFNIYTYSVTVPNESDGNVIALTMTKKEQNEKYSLFYKLYHSQRFMPIFRFRINERINGHHSNAYSAEVFLRCSYNNWVNEIKYIMDRELTGSLELEALLRALDDTDDMKNIRRVSSKLYSFIKRDN